MRIKTQAKEKYNIDKIVERYISCVEEIINVPVLTTIFDVLVDQRKVKPVIEEIILQSRVEFNMEEESNPSLLEGN